MVNTKIPLSIKSKAKNLVKKTARNNRHTRILTFIMFIVIFASIGAYVYMNSRAAGTGIMSITPSNAVIGVGSNITFTITENTTDAINAVQADINYDSTKFQFVSLDFSASAFSTTVQQDGSTPGVVKIAVASLGTTLSGTREIAKLTLRTLAAANPTALTIDQTTSALIRPSDSNNVIGTFNNASVIIDNSVPTVPTGLTAVSATVSSINLSWSASTDTGGAGIAGYRVYRGGTLIRTTTGTATTITDTGLTLGTTYSYTVASYDNAGNASAQSTAVSCRVVDNQAPTVPTNLSATTLSASSLRLSWNASTDNVAVTGYRVYRGGSLVTTTPVTSNNYTDTGLTLGTNYSYTVSAIDAAGNASAQSTAFSYRITDISPPTVPGVPTIQTRTPTSITFGWTASSDDIGVTSYRVYRGGSQIGTSPTNSYSDSTGLTFGSQNTYNVSAQDAAGNSSAQSATATLSTISKRGDINDDGYVSVLDLSILSTNYTLSGRTWSTGDISGPNGVADGLVNIYDLSALAIHWGS
jgi:chitodextrinase